MITLKYEHLLGRPFVYGSADCYGLARDFYKDNWGLKLTDYARPDGWSDTQNLLLDNLGNEGFQLIDEPIHKIRPGDALLLALRSPVANHIGMYLGDSKILHHRQGQLSQVHPFSGIFRNMVCAHVRHPQIVLPKESSTVQLLDLIPAHKRLEIMNAINKGKTLPADSERQEGP